MLSFDSEADSKIFFLGALAGLAKAGAAKAAAAKAGAKVAVRGAMRRAPIGRQLVKQGVNQASQMDFGKKKEQK